MKNPLFELVSASLNINYVSKFQLPGEIDKIDDMNKLLEFYVANIRGRARYIAKAGQLTQQLIDGMSVHQAQWIIDCPELHIVMGRQIDERTYATDLLNSSSYNYVSNMIIDNLQERELLLEGIIVLLKENKTLEDAGNYEKCSENNAKIAELYCQHDVSAAYCNAFVRSLLKTELEAHGTLDDWQLVTLYNREAFREAFLADPDYEYLRPYWQHYIESSYLDEGVAVEEFTVDALIALQKKQSELMPQKMGALFKDYILPALKKAQPHFDPRDIAISIDQMVQSFSAPFDENEIRQEAEKLVAQYDATKKAVLEKAHMVLGIAQPGQKPSGQPTGHTPQP